MATAAVSDVKNAGCCVVADSIHAIDLQGGTGHRSCRPPDEPNRTATTPRDHGSRAFPRAKCFMLYYLREIRLKVDLGDEHGYSSALRPRALILDMSSCENNKTNNSSWSTTRRDNLLPFEFHALTASATTRMRPPCSSSTKYYSLYDAGRAAYFDYELREHTLVLFTLCCL